MFVSQTAIFSVAVEHVDIIIFHMEKLFFEFPEQFYFFVSVLLLLSLNCFFRFVQFRSLILSLWISFEMLVESNNAAHVFSIQPEGSSNH